MPFKFLLLHKSLEQLTVIYNHLYGKSEVNVRCKMSVPISKWLLWIQLARNNFLSVNEQ